MSFIANSQGMTTTKEITTCMRSHSKGYTVKHFTH